MNMRGRIVLLIVVLSMLLFPAGCTNAKGIQTNLNEDKIIVYASIYPMYDFAQKIGGDKIKLNIITPPGVEPHDWEPTAKLMGEMEKADVLIYNGAGMENWVDKVLDAFGRNSVMAVDASRGIDLLKTLETEHEHTGNIDPHIWLNPINAKKQAENIKNAFIQADPANKEFYEMNYKKFSDEIRDLDDLYKESLVNIKSRDIVVSHAAFGYLAQRYNLKQIPISGLSPQEEPSPAQMAQITRLCKERNIKYIFFENLTSPKLAEVLANEVGAETAVLHPIGGLTEDELAEGKDYFAIMKDNLGVLKKTLGE